jgi:hypothetical protein
MNHQPSWLLRSIEVYSNETEAMIEGYLLPSAKLRSLQRLWGRPANDPMVEMFEVTEKQRSVLESIGITPDFRQFTYYLAAHTTDWDAMKRDGGFMGYFPPPFSLPAFPDAEPVKPKTKTVKPKTKTAKAKTKTAKAKTKTAKAKTKTAKAKTKTAKAKTKTAKPKTKTAKAKTKTAKAKTKTAKAKTKTAKAKTKTAKAKTKTAKAKTKTAKTKARVRRH